MVRWDADKNAYITGAVLAELKMTISNQVVQAVLDAWRKLIFPAVCFDFRCDLLLVWFSALFFDVWFWIISHTLAVVALTWFP